MATRSGGDTTRDGRGLHLLRSFQRGLARCDRKRITPAFHAADRQPMSGLDLFGVRDIRHSGNCTCEARCSTVAEDSARATAFVVRALIPRVRCIPCFERSGPHPWR